MRIQRTQELAWRKVGGETIVIHLGRKMMFGLNPAGGRVWEALENPTSLEAIQAAIPAEAAAQETARNAIRAFLADLEGEGLIEAEPPLGPSTLLHDTGPKQVHPPLVVWREEVRRFAGASCALSPTGTAICAQQPFQ